MAYLAFKHKRIVFSLLYLFCIFSVLKAQDSIIPISSEGWTLWLDRDASWKNDSLFIPPVDIPELPVNEPTCGWENLFSKTIPLSEVDKIITDTSLSLDIQVPGTVEEYTWDALSGKGKGLGNSGNYEGVSWWGKEVIADGHDEIFVVDWKSDDKRLKSLFLTIQ